MKDVKMLEIKNKKLLEQIEMLKEQNEKLLERAERAERRSVVTVERSGKAVPNYRSSSTSPTKSTTNSTVVVRGGIDEQIPDEPPEE